MTYLLLRPRMLRPTPASAPRTRPLLFGQRTPAVTHQAAPRRMPQVVRRRRSQSASPRWRSRPSTRWRCRHAARRLRCDAKLRAARGSPGRSARSRRSRSPTQSRSPSRPASPPVRRRHSPGDRRGRSAAPPRRYAAIALPPDRNNDYVVKVLPGAPSRQDYQPVVNVLLDIYSLQGKDYSILSNDGIVKIMGYNIFSIKRVVDDLRLVSTEHALHRRSPDLVFRLLGQGGCAQRADRPCNAACAHAAGAGPHGASRDGVSVEPLAASDAEGRPWERDLSAFSLDAALARGRATSAASSQARWPPSASPASSGCASDDGAEGATGERYAASIPSSSRSLTLCRRRFLRHPPGRLSGRIDDSCGRHIHLHLHI